MTTRTFRQQGQGYGRSDTRIIVRLDDNEIFAGNIPTLNQFMPTGDTAIDMPVIFTWDQPAEFRGTRQIAISVHNGNLLLGETTANNVDPAGPDQFVKFCHRYVGKFQWTSDPFTHIMIDDRSVDVQDRADLSGQWRWKIYSGQTFTATLNINR